MTASTDALTAAEFATVHAEVQQFYAEHMQLLDSGAASEWAATFTEDGSFAPPSAPEPIVGRKALEAGVRTAQAELAESGEVVRHLFGMIAVRPLPDGALKVRSYVQVIKTRRDGEPRPALMCVCTDLLVREEGALLVKERQVTRDDRP
ncbi:nuclear transport factor 2 family protein [Streptomyces glomeratus]|uniref:Nuclear transport factor 2 family protein n=1 Tax=Streptomyces glomeratus TaxID=284452 RepID=A0ABP6LMJ7_9ACTN|nr:nuclear transport factor 2 family protein [Streptomyces glomeratus]MCF1512455.1 nuclear transport factor 2 family protein [Streptomyces glomeratus]